MIIDINAWTGHWHTHPIRGDVESVLATLATAGVDRVCLSPLDAAWCPNPHHHNEVVYEAASRHEHVLPVPVLDPTIPTWRDELERALQQPRLRLVKLLPSYTPYELSAADELASALAEQQLAIIIQTRIEHPFHQHPLARVEQIEVGAVAQFAARHPETNIIIGGAQTAFLREHCDTIRQQPNLYADVSQADGVDGVKSFVDAGITDKLLFGSHAPLFVPHAAMTRVFADLSDAVVMPIIGDNAARLLQINNSE